jgi:hypothetical protein
MNLPDRLSKLIAKVESGADLTPDDVRRTAMLQAMDLAKLGEDFVREAVARDAEATKALAGIASQ